MLQRNTTALLLALVLSLSSQAQIEYSKLPTGFEYKFKRNNPQGKKVEVGSSILFHIKTSLNDSVIYDSKKINNNEPVPSPVMAPRYNCDINEGFLMMREGEQAVFRAPLDSVIRVKNQRPPFAKSGDMMSFEVTMVTVKTKEDLAHEKALYKKKNEASIKDYILKNYLGKKVKKTKSGLYYVITQEGKGPNAKAGQTVTMNYDGYLPNGKKFDSNIDSSFNHVQPFTFPLGQGRVIKGWDEGIALLNKGAKAKLLIPSELAYGSRAMGQKIPAYSVLIFDVELKDIKSPIEQAPKATAAAADPASQEKAIAQYLKKNKLISKVKRTESGLYYIITKKGNGPKAQVGQTVSMNYTGSLINGSVFDSNVDPKFNHVRPFDFPLGQGRVIKGWDEGIALLNVGSQAKLIIPSRLGYGSRSQGAKIPANSILIFDVEMLGTK